MNPYSCLYYPHAGIENEKLIHQGLLLWDQIEFISPFLGYYDYNGSKEILKAKELILKPYLPSNEDKNIAHDIIVELANSDLPEWFFYKVGDEDIYSIYPQKLLPKTWDLLCESKLVGDSENSHEYIFTSSFGLTIMAILADICAGKQKRTITDRTAAYAGLTRYITKAGEGEYVNTKILDEYDTLVTISLELIDVKKIPIHKLINFRERENGTNGYHYKNLRHNYLNKVDSYIQRLCTETKNKGDAEEIKRLFKEEMEDDLESLADALETKKMDIVYSKETMIAIAASAGAIIEPISSGLIGVGTLIRMGLNFTEERKKLQREHAMSWLCDLK